MLNTERSRERVSSFHGKFCSLKGNCLVRIAWNYKYNIIYTVHLQRFILLSDTHDRFASRHGGWGVEILFDKPNSTRANYSSSCNASRKVIKFAQTLATRIVRKRVSRQKFLIIFGSILFAKLVYFHDVDLNSS